MSCVFRDSEFLPEVRKGVVQGVSSPVRDVRQPRLDSLNRFLAITLHQAEGMINHRTSIIEMATRDFLLNELFKIGRYFDCHLALLLVQGTDSRSVYCTTAQYE
jgi:hypothetical protein